jgi:hypothetical protein
VFWILAALVLLIILSITITHRGPVRIIGCVLLAAMLGWGLYQRLNTRPETQVLAPRGRSASPAAVTQPMAADAIELSELKLTGGGAPFELRGRITNRSTSMHLTALTLRTTRRDCYEGAIDPSGCIVIWQDQHWIRWPVPAGQSREFVETIWAHTPVPRARGTTKDEFELIGASGTPAGN